MNWKKNPFSYILWFVYVVLVGVGVLGVSASVCFLKEYPTEYGFGVTAVYLTISGALVFLLRRLVVKHNLTTRVNSMVMQVAEAVFAVVLLAMGLYLRIRQIGLYGAVDANVYYEAAKVVSGQSIPMVVHGGTYLYLHMLRIVFLVLGNKMLAGIALQIGLQMLAAVVFYFAVRRLAGSLSAVVMMMFFMLSPHMIDGAMILSPSMLLLLLFSITLCLVTYCLNKTRGCPVWYIITGILIGLICYLDIFGIVLLVFQASVLTVDREREDYIFNSRAAVLLYGVSGSMVGFFGAIIVDALTSGKKIFNVLRAWCNIYQAKDGEIPFVMGASSAGELVAIILLMGLLAWGIFSFWCDKKQEKLSVWIAATGVILALQTYQMAEQNPGSSVYLYLFMAVLAGIALENIFMVDDSIPINEEVFEALDRMEAARENIEHSRAQVEREPSSVRGRTPLQELTVSAEEPPLKKVNYIENPLPLPKKHIPKVMDYRINDVEESADYDMFVSDEDDCDI